MRYHEVFSKVNIPEEVLLITMDFFESGPWKGSQHEKLAKFQAWYSACCEVMGYDEATVLVINSIAELRMHPSLNVVGISTFSVLELFHAFRHEMHQHDHAPRMDSRCEDAHAWACSLYYLCRTKTFAASVRKGLIPGVTEPDLIPLDDAGCGLSAAHRTAFEGLTDAFVESLGPEDHDLMDLMSEFIGEGE